MSDNFNNRWADKPALSYADKWGYKRGTLTGFVLFAHRVAYAIHHGEYRKDIYHYNGCKWDNRIYNLRARRLPHGLPVEFIHTIKDLGRMSLIQSPLPPLPYPENTQYWKSTTLHDILDKIDKGD
jgi:hypothetical protein